MADRNIIFTFLEWVHDPAKDKMSYRLKEMSECSSPRFFKTHLPFHFLPTDVSAGKSKVGDF